MHEFTLYHLTNIEAEQMVNLMKRAALLLGFIKGPNVKNWMGKLNYKGVQHRTCLN